MNTSLNSSQVLETLAAAVLVVDASGTVTQASARAAKVFARPIADLVGGHIEELVAPMSALLAVADNADSGVQEDAAAASGRRSVLGYSVGRLPDDAGVSVVLEDVTELERLREERDRLLRMAAVSEALPAILHELKNPLASVGTAVELLLEDLPAGRVQADLHAVLTEIRRMSLTLDGLGSGGRELPSNRNQAIDYALQEVHRVFTRRAQEQGIKLRCEVGGMPLLPLDAAVLRGVVFNLMTNALHACEPGDEVALRASFDSNAQELRIEVSDTGCGMSEESRARCCNLFYTTKAKGSGIGLTLVLSAVTSTRGQLDIDTELGRGTVIRLTIPIGGVAMRRSDSNHDFKLKKRTTQAVE